MRKIIHVDMDCFYAAVEIRDNPGLAPFPVAVGGSPKGRGVITTANYLARKFGVRSAMPSARAVKLCPDLIFIKPNFEKYRAESYKVRDIFKRYTELVEPLSLDEAYLDVTDSPLFQGSASLIAQDIRKAIFEETGLTASAGIAPNKFLAKVASDWKKPNGQFTIPPDKIEKFVEELPLSKIPGIGKVTAEKMKAKGFTHCRDLKPLSQMELVQKYGKWGVRLYELVRGIDEREVKTHRFRKSLSVERTFFEDVNQIEELQKHFHRIFDEFLERYRKHEAITTDSEISGFAIKLKFQDFKLITREVAMADVPSREWALQFATDVFTHFDQPIRLFGLGVRLRKIRETNQLEFSF